ncbi:MAG: HRDC domain-containing protein [Spirochaetota bacterium]|jgi:superfamily II DNA helicase RecQ|nr:HRDC domain-containing protein [Spirochaetota bacterium]
MALLTQYASFFISPFGENSVTDELNAFLRSHRIVNVEKKLIDSERGTGWVFLVEYGSDSGKNSQNAPPRVDYKEVLSAAEYALFDKLRTLRKELSEKQGIPVYAVFTNDQLAAMVKKRPKSTKDLLGIPGIGEARVKQYGEAFLNLCANNKEALQDDEKTEPTV